MNSEREPKLRPRMHAAVEELKGLVREHYPGATFRVARSAEEPRIVNLWMTVDVEDTTEVVDTVLDRVLHYQVEERLPIHVIPVRPRERVLAMLREAEEAKARRSQRRAGRAVVELR